MGFITEKALYGVSKPLVGTYTGTMLKMDVQIHDSLPKGAKIIAANHPSTTDPFFIAWVIRQQAFIMIKDTLFNVPILGEYLRRAGHIEVKAGCGQRAVDQAVAHLKDGHTVIIFPEGEISPLSGGFHPSRTGIGRIALESGAPVFPVGIYLDRSRIRTIESTVQGKVEYGHWYLRGPYSVTVGSAMQFSGDSEDRPLVRDVASRVMRRIMDLSYESQTRFFKSSGPVSGAFQII